jgi:hypothetical protein
MASSRQTAVVLSRKDYDRLRRQGEPLGHFLVYAGFSGVEIGRAGG